MCKLNKKNDGRRIDPCMKNLVKRLNAVFNQMPNKPFKILACCCGHGKYQMTIICSFKLKKRVCYVDFISGKIISLRTKKFYKKDKQGYYFIPEVTT